MCFESLFKPKQFAEIFKTFSHEHIISYSLVEREAHINPPTHGQWLLALTNHLILLNERPIKSSWNLKILRHICICLYLVKENICKVISGVLFIHVCRVRVKLANIYNYKFLKMPLLQKGITLETSALLKYELNLDLIFRELNEQLILLVNEHFWIKILGLECS